MSNDTYGRYPRIMEAIDCVGVTIAYMQDGMGEYVAVTEIYGVIIVYTQDSDGFDELRAVTLAELNDILDFYGYNPLESHESIDDITL